MPSLRLSVKTVTRPIERRVFNKHPPGDGAIGGPRQPDQRFLRFLGVAEPEVTSGGVAENRGDAVAAI
jgi:hypothetical protein